MAESSFAWRTSTVKVPSSWPRHTEDTLFVRRYGQGTPILLLHGGWGYEIHSFDAVAADLSSRGFECIAPDRTGYGRSSSLDVQPNDFHQRAAREMRTLLDSLRIQRPILWGHSDGAVIAAWMLLQEPNRFPAAVLESFHFWAQKASSRTFFETAARGGGSFGERTRTTLQADHGPRWSTLVAMNGDVWVRLGTEAPSADSDLFDGRTREIATKVLFLQGKSDPRTEAGEIDAARGSIAGSELVLVEGKHVPHGERATWAEARERVLSFLSSHPGRAQRH